MATEINGKYSGSNSYAVIKEKGTYHVQSAPDSGTMSRFLENMRLSNVKWSDYKFLIIFNGVNRRGEEKIRDAVDRLNHNGRIKKKELEMLLA